MRFPWILNRTNDHVPETMPWFPAHSLLKDPGWILERCTPYGKLQLPEFFGADATRIRYQDSWWYRVSPSMAEGNRLPTRTPCAAATCVKISFR